MGKIKQTFMADKEDDYYSLTPIQRRLVDKRAKQVDYMYNYNSRENANNSKKRK